MAQMKAMIQNLISELISFLPACTINEKVTVVNRDREQSQNVYKAWELRSTYTIIHTGEYYSHP